MCVRVPRHCFYNSLLLLISESHNIVKVACLQCFIGSVGTTILMVSLNMHDLERDKVTERGYVLYCFCLAAVWFVALSIPLWIWLEEDEATQTNTLEVSALSLSSSSALLLLRPAQRCPLHDRALSCELRIAFELVWLLLAAAAVALSQPDRAHRRCSFLK